MQSTIELSGETSLREHAKQCAKKFKTNWIELGRILYTIWKDKLYRDWGYSTFEAYTSKEVGVRKQTSLKLLRSYYFLEKEEPGYLKKDYPEVVNASDLPNYESVDVLRRAKNNKLLDSQDYAQLKKNVLDKGKEVSEVRKDLTTLIKQREELAPEEAWARKKETYVKRMISTLKSLKREAEGLRLLSRPMIENIKDLIDKLETELS